MGLSVKFNGHELAEYIEVLQGFTAYIGADWEPEVLSVGDITRGTQFGYTTYKTKSIPMPFAISGDLKAKYDALQKILNVKEPKTLIFGNTPDREFYAIPSGNLNFEEIVTLGTGEITWLVPDGRAHATVEKTFVAAETSGIMEATIKNSGTEEVPVNYRISHNYENGFVGIVSEHGVIELGDIKELDGEAVEMSVSQMNYGNYSAYSAMATGSGVFFDNTYGKNGTFKETIYDNKSWLDISSAGSGSAETWHGGAKTLVLPESAENFELQSKVWFRPTATNQLGIVEYAIADENDNHLMSVRIAKWQPNRDATYLIFCIGGKEVKRIEFNPYQHTITVHETGDFSMSKSGSKFTFNFDGIHSFDVPELETKKAKRVSVFIGQRESYAMVERMRLQYLKFRKDNVTSWRDIPNRYQEGDEIFIDGESGKVYLNGRMNAQDVVKGSTFFLAPPGETKIQFVFSEFCSELPDITASIREAYL